MTRLTIIFQLSIIITDYVYVTLKLSIMSKSNSNMHLDFNYLSLHLIEFHKGIKK